mgnify:CR=1 FL=1
MTNARFRLFPRMGPPESVPIRDIRGSSFSPFGCGGAALGSLRFDPSGLPSPNFQLLDSLFAVRRS